MSQQNVLIIMSEEDRLRERGIERSKRVRAAHRGSVTRIVGQLENALASRDESPAADEIEPYIVETIERKRFNSNKVQYEYFVKWLGYSCKENTWELPSNIPASILDAYERSLLDMGSGEPPRRAGLRDRSSRKSTNKPDFIVNM